MHRSKTIEDFRRSPKDNSAFAERTVLRPNVEEEGSAVRENVYIGSLVVLREGDESLCGGAYSWRVLRIQSTSPRAISPQPFIKKTLPVMLHQRRLTRLSDRRGSLEKFCHVHCRTRAFNAHRSLMVCCRSDVRVHDWADMVVVHSRLDGSQRCASEPT